MPPQVGRMPGHQSNPAHSSFSSLNFNGGISPFAPSAGGMPGYGGVGAGIGGGGSGLASEAAFAGFARGAQIQQQQAHQAEAAQIGSRAGQAGRIREVWAGNLDQEFNLLRNLILKYPYISMVSRSKAYRCYCILIP
jgi:CCR4-NOT transcription complex subunit 7/8